MSRFEKLLYSILSGIQDKNIAFDDLCKILDRFGFVCRVKGDHFIYTKDGIEEIINIQPKGKMAKSYQVKQVRDLIVKYRMGGAE
ncbi:MAG: type II toxin-antitoxin system HicA family toxin [Agathobaculum sp.]|jgi:predicted RNA binding protein YcfA (HicA-like mRNA interferase family)|uniref:type II toxin-antitoxin system HicA family toxin n=1 Tax=Agathobaculum sp. TaxID=2048138 RepID=UPI003D942D55